MILYRPLPVVHQKNIMQLPNFIIKLNQNRLTYLTFNNLLICPLKIKVRLIFNVNQNFGFFNKTTDEKFFGPFFCQPCQELTPQSPESTPSTCINASTKCKIYMSCGYTLTNAVFFCSKR